MSTPGPSSNAKKSAESARISSVLRHAEDLELHPLTEDAALHPEGDVRADDGEDSVLGRAPGVSGVAPSDTKREVGSARPTEPNTPCEVAENQPSGSPQGAIQEVFNGTPKAEIDDLDLKWYRNKKAGVYPTIADDAREIVVVPPMPRQGLPPHLQPWAGVLDQWEASSRSGKDRRKLPMSLKNESIWSVAGPRLPEGAEPWLLSLGVDPGLRRDLEDGFTRLLLVAAPRAWLPSAVEVALEGRFGEVLVHRCDGTCMRIPRAWWEKWAYGAMAEGALYAVIDPGSES